MELIILLIVLAVACVLSGPVAFFMVLSLSRKLELLEDKFLRRAKSHPVAEPAEVVEIEQADLETDKQVAAKVEPAVSVQAYEPESSAVKEDIAEEVPDPEILTKDKKPDLLLEQKIGTKWLPIAGFITVLVGVGFLLVYAYENFTLSETARIIAVTVCGFLALLAGEITRRRDYDVVAKVMTALGFAMFYAAIFTAYQLYGLIGFLPAFIFASITTAGAMTYAVVLDEVLMAFLSLLGGYLAPAIILPEIYLPTPLFVYILVLSVGAMMCSYFRKWRAVNLLSFAGTFVLYTMWYYIAVYKPIIAQGRVPIAELINYALGWVSAFFGIYFVMPILYEFVNRVKAHKEEVLLILLNSAATFFFFCTTLYEHHKEALAFCAVGLGAIHLLVMAGVFKRCKEDKDLRLVLLCIGLFFVTVAVPLYFKMHVVAVVWGAEAVVLLLIGLRYESVWIRAAAGIVLLLSCGKLLFNLPMHNDSFKLILNPAFGTWFFVSGCGYVSHLLCRRSRKLSAEESDGISQMFYVLTGLVLFAAFSMEWYLHCRYNLGLAAGFNYISRGQLPVFAAIVLLFAVRPVCPKGIICEAFTVLLLTAGTIFTIATLFFMHDRSFRIFANFDFVTVVLFITAMAVCHIKYRQFVAEENGNKGAASQVIFGALGILLLLAVCAEWFWHCKLNLGVDANSAPFLKGQLIVFAITMLLFVVRPICPKGVVPMAIASVVGFVGSMFAMVAFTEFYEDSFVLFFNTGFGVALLFVGALFLASRLLAAREDEADFSRAVALGFVLAGVFVLWVLLISLQF